MNYDRLAECPQFTVVNEYVPELEVGSGAHESEAQLERKFISILEGQGYEYLNTLTEESDLVANLRVQMEKLNHVALWEGTFSDREWERFYREVLSNPRDHVVEKTAKFQEIRRFDFEFDDHRHANLMIFDAENVNNNRLQVINQYEEHGGRHEVRYDVTVLVNGLPVVHVELKRRGVALREAFNQIKRYNRDGFWAGDALFEWVQVFVISNGTETKYYANTTRDNHVREMNSRAVRSGRKTSNSFEFTSYWADARNRRISDLTDFAKTFFAQQTLRNILAKFCVFSEERMLMVMRPYQIAATERILERIRIASNGRRMLGTVDAGGYIWHSTGSGKTLTSFKTAQILAARPEIKKVVFLVDRKDLDSQTTEEFNKFEQGSVDATDRTDILVKQMKDKNRPLIVTTMQKMAIAVKGSRYAKVMDAYKDEKVVFIIDECHRSQFGDMHRDIIRHFSKAQFFGFTGTPRFEVNGMTEGHRVLTTETLFGECLHNYLIKDAIFDNNVLGFHIEYIKTIEGNYEKEDGTLVEGIDTDEIYGANERLTLIANHIISNHKSRTRNCQYTAIFAVSSIPTLIRYYDLFKSINHNLSVGAIFSYGANEDAEGKDELSRDALERIIGDYNAAYGTNFSTDTFSAYHKDVSDRVKGKKTKQLDILLVVDMFLTGFDSKPLSVLYVDKELQYHTLLQAYSRTNRVERETKPFGIIICYRNLKRRTDEALALFSKVPKPFKGVITPGFDYYVAKFNEYALKLKEIALFPESVDTMQNEEDQRQFVVVFRELTKYLQSLKTFIEFTIDKSPLVMSEQEYEDYKSKYLMLYQKSKNARYMASVLNDVDFCIELMESDRINVAYIMNLIRNIRFESADKKRADVEDIKREIDRTDNPQLRKKSELLKNFLDSVVVGLKNADEVDAAYNDFENEAKRKEIETFAKAEDLQPNLIAELVAVFEFSGAISVGEIRDRIDKPLPLRKRIELSNRIADFITTLTEKYQ